MKRHTVTFRFNDFDRMHYPSLCPGCLSEEPTEHIEIISRRGIPLPVRGVKTRSCWPVCKKCSELNKKTEHLRWSYTGIKYILNFLVFIFGIPFTFGELTKEIGVLLIISTMIFTDIIITSLCKLRCTKIARTMGLPFGHPCIKVHAGGRMRKGLFIVFDCYFSEYARAFVETNLENGELKVRPKLQDA